VQCQQLLICLQNVKVAVSLNRYKLYRSVELVILETEASLIVPLLNGIAFKANSVCPSPSGIGIDVVLLHLEGWDPKESYVLTCPYHPRDHQD
jgi:hypothetical protein